MELTFSDCPEIPVGEVVYVTYETYGDPIPTRRCEVLEDECGNVVAWREVPTYSFANIQWPQFTFTPKPEPSPDAKPAVAGLMRVSGKARGLGWCDE